jgi:hypothetical protein
LKRLSQHFFGRTGQYSALLFLSLCLTGCIDIESPYFSSYEETIDYFETKEQQFQRVAEQWWKEGHGDRFCYFRADSYRWQDKFIKRHLFRYSVNDSNKMIGDNLSFEEAANLAGTSSNQLGYWIKQAEDLKIYSIDNESHGGWVEILLKGSDYAPYGLRYIPLGHDEALKRSLKAAESQSGVAAMDKMTKHIKGRWFYFKASHF